MCRDRAACEADGLLRRQLSRLCRSQWQCGPRQVCSVDKTVVYSGRLRAVCLDCLCMIHTCRLSLRCAVVIIWFNMKFSDIMCHVQGPVAHTRPFSLSCLFTDRPFFTVIHTFALQPRCSLQTMQSHCSCGCCRALYICRFYCILFAVNSVCLFIIFVHVNVILCWVVVLSVFQESHTNLTCSAIFLSVTFWLLNQEWLVTWKTWNSQRIVK